MFTLDSAHYPMDLDTRYYAAGLLDGKAAKRYQNIGFVVNEDAAKEQGGNFDRKLAWLTWRHFRKVLTERLGGSLTRDKAVMAGESLHLQPGKLLRTLTR